MKEYWIVDPEDGRVLVYDFKNKKPVAVYGGGQKIPVGIFGGAFRIDFKEIEEVIR